MHIIKRRIVRPGFGKGFALSTLSRANANRDYRIFEEFAALMIDESQKCRADTGFEIRVIAPCGRNQENDAAAGHP